MGNHERFLTLHTDLEIYISALVMEQTFLEIDLKINVKGTDLLKYGLRQSFSIRCLNSFLVI